MLHHDFETVVFQSGLDAFTWMKEGNDPSLIIADLNLPEMSGYEFIARIKSGKKYSKVPLIVISSEEDERVRERCYQAGAVKYFLKPADLEELYTSVRDVCNSFMMIAC